MRNAAEFFKNKILLCLDNDVIRIYAEKQCISNTFQYSGWDQSETVSSTRK